MEPKISEKVWDPKIELEIRKKWEGSKLYEFHPDADGYTIDTPPPYPSGRPWHIGAAAHYSQMQDQKYSRSGFRSSNILSQATTCFRLSSLSFKCD